MSNPIRHLGSFICHSSGDKHKVRELYERLYNDGFAPWLDEENLLAGQDWQQKINEAVRSSDVVIVCLSLGAINKAGFVQKEIKLALDAADEQPEDTIFIIPVKLEECTIPERLRRWHCINLFEEKGYERLISSLQHRSKSLGIETLANTKDSLTTLLISQEYKSARPANIEPTPPLTKRVTPLTRLARSWLVAGLAFVLLTGLTVAARLAFPHWFVTAVKPYNQKPQSPENLNSPKLATPTDLNIKRRLNGHGGVVWSVTFSPDGELAASASQDKVIILWDTKTWNPKFTLAEHTGEVYSVAFSPDGKTLASASKDKTIKLWDTLTGQLIDTLPPEDNKPILRLAFSPNGNLLASCSGEPENGGEVIRLWDARKGWKSKTLRADMEAVLAIAFSPDGSTLVSAGFDKKLRFWNLTSDSQSQELSVDQPLTTLTFSADGKYLACGSNNGVIWLYQQQAQKWKGLPEALEAHESFIISIAFSPDNKTLASASTDNTVRLWDIVDRVSKRLSVKEGEIREPQRSLAFSPDGQTLVTGGMDKIVRVWQ
jgi:dipeptidyl aminopeptidase/acylaminoacyl peptidase